MRRFRAFLMMVIAALAAVSMNVVGALADKESEYIDIGDLKDGEVVDVGHGAAGGKLKSTSVPSVKETVKPTATPTAEPKTVPTTDPTLNPTVAPTFLPEYTTKMIKVVLTPSVPDIYYQNTKVVFDTKPFIDENNRTQVPIRAVAEMLGFNVKYNETGQEIIMNDSYRNVSLTIGSNIITVDDEKFEMDTTAKIINDRTYIPLRAIVDALGCGVIWE